MKHTDDVLSVSRKPLTMEELIGSDVSSEDESCSAAADGSTHPHSTVGVGLRKSMYSRIYEDVRFQIPDIDTNFLESPDFENEEEKLANCAVAAKQDFIVPIDAKKCKHDDKGCTNSTLKTECQHNNAIAALKAGPQLENSYSAQELPKVLNNEPYDNSKIVLQEFISSGNEPVVSKSLNFHVNDASNTTNDAAQDGVVIDGNSMGMSVENSQELSKIEFSSEAGALVLVLKDHIEDTRLDLALKDIDEYLHIEDREEPSNKYNLEKMVESKIDNDDETHLLSKLSLLSLDAKETASETDMLLEQICTDKYLCNTLETETSLYHVHPCNSMDSSSSTKFAMQSHSDCKGNKQTVFLDLRNNSQNCKVTKTESVGAITEDNCPSSSDEEDWDAMRHLFKYGIKGNSLKSDQAVKAGAYTKKKSDHKKDNSLYTKTSCLDDQTLHDPQKKFITGHEKPNINDKVPGKNESFDIQPLFRKIKSWHSGHDLSEDESIMKNDMLSNECSKLKTHVCAAENSHIEIASSLQKVPQAVTKIDYDSSLLELESSSKFGKSHKIYNTQLSRTIGYKPQEQIHVNDNLLLIKGDLCTEKEVCFSYEGKLENNVGTEHGFQRPTKSEFIKSMAYAHSKPCQTKSEESIETLTDANKKFLSEEEQNQSLNQNEIKKDIPEKMSVDSNGHINIDRRMESNPTSKIMDQDQQKECLYEIELNVISKTEMSADASTKSTEAQNLNHMSLKGLLPLPTMQLRETKGIFDVNSKYAQNDFSSIEEISGEETPFLKTERRRSSKFNERTDKQSKLNKTSPNIEQNVDYNSNIISNGKEYENIGNTSIENLNENAIIPKNKKKSRKKNRKNPEEPQLKELNEICFKNNRTEDVNVSLNRNGLKDSISTELQNSKQKHKSSLLKENEKVKIKEKVHELKSKYGATDIIFDEDVSFSRSFQTLPSSSSSWQKCNKLLLQTRLECPGVCSKPHVKNNLSFKERSDAYIGLCTFFLSLLRQSKYNVSQHLKIPFDVIAIQQACVDSKLNLFIGIVENDVSQESQQALKKGKLVKVKKNFFQIVSQYLNKTDLESVLSDMMMFNVTDSYNTSKEEFCPGSRKLSCFVSVSQDDEAVIRMFGLRPSILWNRTRQHHEALFPHVFWLPETDRRNENTVVLIDNISSMLPQTIAAFMKMIRELSLDICGLRTAYIVNADGVDKLYFVVALRGPNATTVQAGKTFTCDSPGLTFVKSNYMPLDLSSDNDVHKSVLVSGPKGLQWFKANITEPLITYTIGRGRGDREVVRWFGPKIGKMSDLELRTDNNDIVRSSKSTLTHGTTENFDVFPESFSSSMLLSVHTDRVVLSISPLVPSVFLSSSLTMAASRGLYALSVGKIVVNVDDFTTLGFKVENGGDHIFRSKKRRDIARTSYCVNVIVFEGENAQYKAIGIIWQLYKQLNSQLSHDSLTKSILEQKKNGLMRYENITDKRNIDDFFALTAINKNVARILEKMTTPKLTNNDVKLIGKIPFLQNNIAHETSCICAVVLFGMPILEMFTEILDILFRDCVDDPLCKTPSKEGESIFMYQERPSAEIIGLKHFQGLPKHVAHVCSQYVIGSPYWASSVNDLQKEPVVIMILRFIKSHPDIIDKCEHVNKYVKKRQHHNELQCATNTPFDTYAFIDLETVLRIMLTTFDVNELQPDSCCSWFKDTQWPIYLSYTDPIFKKLDPILGLFDNVNEQVAFKTSNNIKMNEQERRENIRIISPLSLNLPAALLLGSQPSLSFLKFIVDFNYPKYLAKVLSIIGRDHFRIVALAFPASVSPIFDDTPKMCVVVRRHNAVYRLNQWLPGLTSELRNKHILEVSPTARHAYEAIKWHFQRSEAGGVFDDSCLCTAEKLTFREDDIFASRQFRKIEWLPNTIEKQRSVSGENERCHVGIDIANGLPFTLKLLASTSTLQDNINHNNKSVSATKIGAITEMTNKPANKTHCRSEIDSSCCIMPEIIVIIITSIMIRGKFLGETLSENAKFLGFWEKLSSSSFKTIGARMLALKREETDKLLDKLQLPDKEHSLMMERIPSSNGPLFALALLRDFALSNFWSIVAKTLNENEAQLIKENVLIPSNKQQVEILLVSLFETLVPNSKVEIRKVE